ncbi:LicD family protein [Clostridium perfringens]|nr:LicD family protein [Clostridium perfringens]ELC8352138.1 LicD family protein [Clostridium perfringens]
MKNKNEIREVQLVLLEILKDIDKICREHEIEYFLDAGTLLGAIRHKGFIPWDDDIDIIMMRNDYIKFLDLSKFLLKKYDVSINNIKEDYYKSWSKIGSKDIFIKEKNGNERGVYVDIFPFDYYSENRYKRLCIDRFFKFKKNSSNGVISSILESIIIFFQKIICMTIFSFSIKRYVNLKNKFCLSSNKKSSIVGYGKEVEKFEYYINYTDIFPLKEVEFEGNRFYAPKNHEKFLSMHYGKNYMQLPPIDKRVSHNNGFIFKNS